MDGVYFHDFEIYVDIWGQLEINKFFDHTLGRFGKIPTFPLNTDGIDPSGKNILIERVKITNFDDAVAVKPMDKNGKIATCSENVMVMDLEVWYGVGMTIGTVPARTAFTCVNQVTFKNVTFHHPLKAIYIKQNPCGNKSTIIAPGKGGIISNIVYEDIYIRNPVWWNVYIGPQQQNQPGDDKKAFCSMFYPIGDCPTIPEVGIYNVTLRNVHTHGGILWPGVIRCDPLTPCTGFVFDNVTHTAWFNKIGLNYLT